jgi:hypothetical protein
VYKDKVSSNSPLGQCVCMCEWRVRAPACVPAVSPCASCTCPHPGGLHHTLRSLRPLSQQPHSFSPYHGHWKKCATHARENRHLKLSARYVVIFSKRNLIRSFGSFSITTIFISQWSIDQRTCSETAVKCTFTGTQSAFAVLFFIRAGSLILCYFLFLTPCFFVSDGVTENGCYVTK